MSPLWPWPNDIQQRIKIVDLPLLSIGNQDVPITWATAMPDAQYSVQCTVETGTLGLGKISAQPKQGTITATGLTVTLTNNLLVSLAAGAKLHVQALQLSE